MVSRPIGRCLDLTTTVYVGGFVDGLIGLWASVFSFIYYWFPPSDSEVRSMMPGWFKYSSRAAETY